MPSFKKTKTEKEKQAAATSASTTTSTTVASFTAQAQRITELERRLEGQLILSFI